MTQAIAANEVGEFESLSVVPRRSQPDGVGFWELNWPRSRMGVPSGYRLCCCKAGVTSRLGPA